MKDYTEDNRYYEFIVLSNKIAGAILLPIVFLVLLIYRIRGIPYPILPLGILFVSCYICMRISMASIKSGLNPIKTLLFILIISSVLNVVCVHYTGGIESPLFVFFALIFIMSAAVLPTKHSIFIVFLGYLLYFTELWLEYFMIIPHIHIFNAFNPKIF